MKISFSSLVKTDKLKQLLSHHNLDVPFVSKCLYVTKEDYEFFDYITIDDIDRLTDGLPNNATSQLEVSFLSEFNNDEKNHIISRIALKFPQLTSIQISCRFLSSQLALSELNKLTHLKSLKLQCRSNIIHNLSELSIPTLQNFELTIQRSRRSLNQLQQISERFNDFINRHPNLRPILIY